jgi:hypothetical protein
LDLYRSAKFKKLRKEIYPLFEERIRQEAEDARKRQEEERKRREENGEPIGGEDDTTPGKGDVSQEKNSSLQKTMTSVVEGAMDSAQDSLLGSFEQASGEDDEFMNNAVWTSGFVGSSKDSKMGVKNKFQGGSIGYQRFANCSSIVGVALTKVNGTSKSAGANLKNNSHILSAYTLMEMNNILLGAYLFGGKSLVKSSRYGDAGLLATGKFSSYIYGVSGSLGYAIQSENHTLTPTIALSYYGSRSKAYKEKGEDAKSFGKQSGRSLVGKVGAKYSYTIVQDNMKIVPSLSVGIMRDLMMKSSAAGLQSDDASESVFKMDKPRKKTSVYVKPALTLKSELFDFSMSYGLEKAKKYTGHVGSAKLVVKF